MRKCNIIYIIIFPSITFNNVSRIFNNNTVEGEGCVCVLINQLTRISNKRSVNKSSVIYSWCCQAASTRSIQRCCYDLWRVFLYAACCAHRGVRNHTQCQVKPHYLYSILRCMWSKVAILILVFCLLP